MIPSPSGRLSPANLADYRRRLLPYASRPEWPVAIPASSILPDRRQPLQTVPGSPGGRARLARSLLQSGARDQPQMFVRPQWAVPMIQSPACVATSARRGVSSFPSEDRTLPSDIVICGDDVRTEYSAQPLRTGDIARWASQCSLTPDTRRGLAG